MTIYCLIFDYCGAVSAPLVFCSDPNRDPYGISERSGLETTREDTVHRLGRLALGGCGHMGIGVQGEPCREGSQHPGHCFDVTPVLKNLGCKGVPQIVEAELC